MAARLEKIMQSHFNLAVITTDNRTRSKMGDRKWIHAHIGKTVIYLVPKWRRISVPNIAVYYKYLVCPERWNDTGVCFVLCRDSSQLGGQFCTSFSEVKKIYDGPYGSLSISTTIPNSEFWIPNSEFRSITKCAFILCILRKTIKKY